MATNDGYAPYPLGLTAAQVKNAITRAFNLDNELGHNSAVFTGRYVGYSDSPQPPTLAQGIKEGDIWHDVTRNKFYRAYIEGTTLVYFEV